MPSARFEPKAKRGISFTSDIWCEEGSFHVTTLPNPHLEFRSADRDASGPDNRGHRHFIKNSLATVQAIATQTLNQHAEERDAFIARLHALGNAHDLLTSETRQAASLQAIVSQALKPFQEQHHERIAVEGPANVWLDSTKSVVLAMVVHELATNALKYGALSNGSGYISVKWMQHSQPSLVKLVWQESGGPEISPPQRKGFGSHLIERAFGGQLGTAQLVFSPQGLSCTLEVEL